MFKVSVDKTTDDNKHSGDVTSIVLHDGFLYSSGSDGKIKVRFFSQIS